MAKDVITGDDVLKGVVERIQETRREFGLLVKEYNDFSKSLNNIKNAGGANDAIAKNTQLNERNAALLTKITALEKEKTTVTLKGAAATRTNLTAFRSMNSVYQQQSRLLNNLRDRYKSLEVQKQQGIALTKKEEAEYAKLRTRVVELDGALKRTDANAKQFQRNVGNYPKGLQSMVGIVKQLVGVFGVVEGLRIGVNFVKDALAIAREAKGIEFAFDRLGKSGVDAFDSVKKSTRGLLSDLDIKRSLVDFQNFNISLKESDTLFEFLSVRAAQTGKSIDYLRDSLVEGLSKESKLRIDNLGISAGELNAELEKTPDFVQAVANIAKREIAEAGNILDEAANGGARLNASLQNIKVSFGQIFATVKGLGAINDFFESYSERLEIGSRALRANVGLMELGRIHYRNFTEAGRAENKRLLDEIDLRKENAKAVQQEIDAFVRRNGSMGPLPEEQDGADAFSLEAPEKRKRLLSDINAELEKYNDQLKEGMFSTREEAKVIQEKIALLEKEREAILGAVKSRDKVGTAINGTIAYYSELIRKEEDFQKSEAKNSEQIQNSIKKVDEYNEAIKRLIGAREKLVALAAKETGLLGISQTNKQGQIMSQGVFDGLFDSSILDNTLKKTSEAALKRLAKDLELHKSTEERKTEISKKEAEKRGEIFNVLFSTFADIYGLDLTLFEKMISKEKVALADYANFAKSGVAALYDGKFARYEEDERRNRETLNAILNDENASDKKKEQAQREFDKKERKIRQEKAKAAKEEALFQIAINTAVAVVKSLPNYIQAAAVAAIGGIQAGIVSARKIPQYYKGVDNAPRGWAWTDEKGPEIHTDRKGNIKDFGSDKGPRMKFLESGDRIFTAERTRDMLKYSKFDKKLETPTNIGTLLLARMERDTSARMAMFAARATIDPSGIEIAVERAMKKYADRPLYFNGTINTSPPRTRY